MDGEKTKILIVDDDTSTREMYAEVFKNANFDVSEAQDGVEGLDKASKENPDLIFTGIIMPKMDGFSMMEALKKNVATAGIPIVICSHMGREQDQQRANVLGAKDFIIRDLTPPNEVVRRIKDIFSAGGDYKVIVDPYALDAQKLFKDLNFSANKCTQCGEKLILEMKLTDPKEKIFQARFVCPSCGWVAK